MKPAPFLTLASLAILLLFGACSKDKQPSDPLAGNPTRDMLNNAVRETDLGMRVAIDRYLDATGIIGRELYRFSPNQQLYTTELLGSGNLTLNANSFYFKEPWNARYEVVKKAVQIMNGAARSTQITDAELRGFTGYAKTIIAYQLLMNLSMTYTNGIYINLGSNNPASGPVVLYPAALDSIARFLNEAKAALPGSAMPPLTIGFTDFTDAAGFLKFNRALAARVALYRQRWAESLTALNESFFDLNGSITKGPQMAFYTSGDNVKNPCFIPQNQTGDVRVTHPSMASNITAGDDRIQKSSLRTAVVSQDGLNSNRDVWVFATEAAKIPIINNEELALIYAEAKLQLNQLPDGIVAINRIRTVHNLPPYAGAITQAALVNELLHQRRYSLYGLGHRWIDMRRYDKLASLPTDRAGDDVWDKFPLP